MRKTETRAYAADTSIFSNALMGYAPGILSGDDGDVTLYYLGLTWRELEPEEGSYAWDALDEKYGLTQLRERGVHLVLRFICDYPRDEVHLDIPDWLYEQTGDGSVYDISYGKGYSPNYSNAIFRAAHTKAVTALGEYFGADGFASFVELGSLGHWGEWHIKSGEGLVPMPEEEIRDEYVSSYIAAFPDAKLLMRRPFTIAAQEGLGVYNDMTGEPTATAEWLDWLANGGTYGSEENALTAMPDFWLTAPVGGEFTSSLSMEEMTGTELPRTLEMLEASHATFLGPKVPDAQENEEGYSAVLGALGYRLRIESATLRQSLFGATLTLVWTNDGASPFYWDWDAEVTVETANGESQTVSVPLKLTTLAPGQRQTVRVRLQSLPIKLLSESTARITVGIIDPMTEKYAVRLAMQAERTEDGRTILFDE